MSPRLSRRSTVLFSLFLLLCLFPYAAFAQAPTVQFSVPSCTDEARITVSGDVSGGASIARVAGSIDGGMEQDICLGCGIDPSFSFQANLGACDNSIRVSAESDGGEIGDTTRTVRFDDEGAVFTCPDSVFVNGVDGAPTYGDAEVIFDPVTAVDACDGSLVPSCYRSDADFVGPGEENFYRQGTASWVCSKRDSCNNQGFCNWLVTVLPPGKALPAAGCTFYDYRDLELLESQTPGVIRATIGDVFDWEEVSIFPGARVEVVNAPLDATSDHGLFLYRERAGDFRAELPLGYGSGSGDRAAGLMMRWGFDEQAARAFVALRPDASGGVIEFLVRTDFAVADQQMATSVPATGVTDIALELEGNRVTAQYSVDGGHTWTTPTGGLGGAATVAAIGDTQVGPFTSSTAPGSYHIYPYLEHCPILGVDPGPGDPGPGDPPSNGEGCQDDDFEDDAVASDWTLSGLGHGNQLAVSEADGQLELTGAGATAFISSDNGVFLHKSADGDFRMEVTLDANDMTTGGNFRKAGLMMRSSLDPWAPRLIAQLIPFWNGSSTESHLQFVAREVQGGPGNVTVASDVVGTARAVRLAIERMGDTFEVQYSLDGGATWTTPTGGLDGVIDLTVPETVLVGLDVISNNVSVPSTVVFDDFTLCPLCRVDDFEDGELGAAWTLTGLGNANQVSGEEAAGVFSLTADGATAFTGADNAGFLYRQVEGDFRAEVTVDGNDMTTGGKFRKTGLMIRSSLDPWAPRLIAQLAPFWNNSATETHLQFVAREVQNGFGNKAVATDVVGVPRVVRLAIERTGNVFGVQYSTDGGATWTTPTGGHGGSITLNMPSTILLGLDMVSNDISVTSTSHFDDFSVCSGGS